MKKVIVLVSILAIFASCGHNRRNSPNTSWLDKVPDSTEVMDEKMQADNTVEVIETLKTTAGEECTYSQQKDGTCFLSKGGKVLSLDFPFTRIPICKASLTACIYSAT